jgi:PAS domain S-box-containing protein
MSQVEPSQSQTEPAPRRSEQRAAIRVSLKTPILKSVRPTSDLYRRRSRPPDHAAENRALIALSEQLAISPTGILQKLADTALTLCGAGSAGVSLLEADGKRFYWPAVAGQWAEYLGGGTPREYGPCGTVLDRNSALLFSHPERDFDYFAPVTPLVEEALLMPFYIHGKAVGTVWIVAHDTSRRFESEDLRLMTDLGTFASSAYQALQSLNAMQGIASIVGSSDDAIITKDLNGIITSWNGGAERLFGFSADEAIGKSVTILTPADNRNEEPAILERIGRGERIDHYETTGIRKDGCEIDISLCVSPVKDALGKIVGASKIARDITGRREAHARISVLAREAEHRTKNILTTVQAAVSLTQADTVAGLKAAIEGRIQALAKANALFIETRWVGAALDDLVTQELAPYRRDLDARIRIDGPSCMLEPNTAQTVAVAVHELATNAVKYGALSAADGRVHVAWSIRADGELLIRWAETGGPLVTPPKHQGFGTRVMEKMVGQIRGHIRLDWRADGLVCEITLPIPS